MKPLGHFLAFAFLQHVKYEKKRKENGFIFGEKGEFHSQTEVQTQILNLSLGEL